MAHLKSISLTPEARNRLEQWAASHPYCLILDSCGVADRYGAYQWLIAWAGESASIYTDWDSIQAAPAGWKMGALSYELKVQMEPRLLSHNPKGYAFPHLGFFVPDTVVYLPWGATEVWVEGEWPVGWETENDQVEGAIEIERPFFSLFSRKEYCETVETLKEHIRQGDFYEINLTQEFEAKAKMDQPLTFFRKLCAISPVPAATYFRFGEIHTLCASPERFLALRGETLITQPIKGTRKRGRDAAEDEALKLELFQSEKERAENVMIVDLARNDLYRSCEVNSVKVPHLFEVQTFPQVHHLVSTVTGVKRPDISGWEVIERAFPPGSMTGAPKVSACEWIDHYERSARGIYAGSIGYFAPSGDFDLNVVIRTLIYHAETNLLSYHVGGAITYDSDPEAEYEETLVKAKAIAQLLGPDSIHFY